MLNVIALLRQSLFPLITISLSILCVFLNNKIVNLEKSVVALSSPAQGDLAPDLTGKSFGGEQVTVGIRRLWDSIIRSLQQALRKVYRDVARVAQANEDAARRAQRDRCEAGRGLSSGREILCGNRH